MGPNFARDVCAQRGLRIATHSRPWTGHAPGDYDFQSGSGPRSVGERAVPRQVFPANHQDRCTRRVSEFTAMCAGVSAWPTGTSGRSWPAGLERATPWVQCALAGLLAAATPAAAGLTTVSAAEPALDAHVARSADGCAALQVRRAPAPCTTRCSRSASVTWPGGAPGHGRGQCSPRSRPHRTSTRAAAGHGRPVEAEDEDRDDDLHVACGRRPGAPRSPDRQPSRRGLETGDVDHAFVDLVRVARHGVLLPRRQQRLADGGGGGRRVGGAV